MSFSKSKSKRFNDTVPEGPAVGSYDITKAKTSAVGPVSFNQGNRFQENKEQTPGPADVQPLLENALNLSAVSGVSSVSFATPCTPAKKRARIKSSSVTDLTCKEELSRQVSHLQYRIDELEKNLQRALKEKRILEKDLKQVNMEKEELLCKLDQIEIEVGSSSSSSSKDAERNEEIQSQLDISQQDVSRLRQENIDLEGQKKALEADVDFANQTACALKQQISNLGTFGFQEFYHILSYKILLLLLMEQVRYDKRMCEDEIMKLQTTLQEHQSRFSQLQRSHEEDQDNLTKIEKKLEDEKQEHRSTKENLDQLKQILDEVSQEKKSLQDNLFNLEKVKSLIEEQKEELNAEFGKVANEKADLEEELENLENTTTENLRCLTLKYQSLEENNEELRKEFFERETLLTSELQITKQSYVSIKDDLEAMKNTYKGLSADYSQLMSEANDLEKKCGEMQTRLTKSKEENEELNEMLQLYQSRYEKEKLAFETKIEELTKDVEKQANDAQSQKKENEQLVGANKELEEENAVLFRRMEKIDENIEKKDLEVDKMKKELQQALSLEEEKLLKVKEELGKRIVETQTKLAKSEHLFERKMEAEQEKYAELQKEHIRLQSQSGIDAMNAETDLYVYPTSIQFCSSLMFTKTASCSTF
eukprot:Seg2415.3 transcript_id=Seg2415.3/GoldUCD/mRNA.D3Y31 product="Hyaluronan mediated motility receptor" protein_id=Seg2415.3/GoldUCD/D3Y31